MVGALSALLGTSIWLIVATFFKLPVSGTHSVVGATIGYALVASGAKGVSWSKFGMIGMSVMFHLIESLVNRGGEDGLDLVIFIDLFNSKCRNRYVR